MAHHTVSAAHASAKKAHTVPDWVEKNRKIFKTPPPGYHDPTSQAEKRKRAAERDALLAHIFGGADDNPLNAGVGGSVLTDASAPGINLPTGPQPADYWKNVANHANILATFYSTARRAVGYVPEITTANLTAAEAAEYLQKFNAWIAELDSYNPYLILTSSAKQTVQNNSTDCTLILDGVSSFLMALVGLSEGTAKAMEEGIKGVLQAASKFLTKSTGTFINTGYTMETPDTSGKSDPLQPLTFTSTVMSKQTSGKSVAQSSTVNLAAVSYMLNSSLIIAMADQLAAGSTLEGALQYMNYVNAPIQPYM